MTSSRFAAFASALVLTTALTGLALGFAPRQADEPTAPMTFDIDAVHSTALFRVQHLKAGQFWGRFNDISGTFTYGGDAMPAFDVSIDINSVDTNSSDLDSHLKSEDFFNAEEFPAMTFKSTSVTKGEGNMYAATGTLTIRGHAEEVTANIEWTGANDGGPRMGHRCGYEATFTIKRSKFGVSYGVDNGALGDETRIIVALEGVKQKTE